MPFKQLTVWIFVLLILIIAVMILFPTPTIIGLGTIGVPLLVAFQAFVILKAGEESKENFSDKWYDRH